MILPLYMHETLSRPTGMVVAVLIGFGFGFVLERSGFGRSTVLTDQFYLNNMRVFKVMFSAIVTAMLGVFTLSALGMLDLSLVRIPATFLWPQIAGGFLLGVGFIISGHCPGTAVVGAASGNMDALVAFLGTALGTLVFGAFYPQLVDFYNSGAMGELRLPDVLGLSEPFVVLAVVLMAALGFLGAEWVERRTAKPTDSPDPTNSEPPRRRNRVYRGWGLATAVGSLIFWGGLSFARETPRVAAWSTITPIELARGLVENPDDYFVVDLRAPEPGARPGVPGAMRLTADDAEGEFIAALPPTRTLVLYGQEDLLPSLPALQGFTGPIATLAGGFAAFENKVLQAPTPPQETTPENVAEYRLRAALHAHYTGAAAAAPVALKPVQIKRARKKEGGC